MTNAKKKPAPVKQSDTIEPSAFAVTAKLELCPAFIYDALYYAGFDESISFWAAHDGWAAARVAEHQLKYGTQMLSHSDFMDEIKTEYRCYIRWIKATWLEPRKCDANGHGSYEKYKKQLLAKSSEKPV